MTNFQLFAFDRAGEAEDKCQQYINYYYKLYWNNSIGNTMFTYQ